MSAPSAPVPAPPRTPAELRKFGLQLAAIFVVFGLLSWFVSHHESRAKIFWGLSGLLIVLGLAAPRALAPLERGMIKLGEAIGKVTTPVILGMFYYLIVTPFGWVRRATSGDSLNRRMRDGEKSNWIKRTDKPDHESYRQQF